MKTRKTLTLVLVFFLLVGFVSAREPFSVVVMPDTQNYAEQFPETYVAQTRWIRDNVEQENIKFVMHLGDIVQHFNDSEEQWQVADRAHQLLDGIVPYSVLPGNHDLGRADKQLTRETRLYNKYFGPPRFADYPWYGGHWGETNDNNFCTFEAGGMKFLVVSLEYAPRDEVLAWARGVTGAHPEHRVLVATHCYMRPGGRDSKSGGDLGNSGDGVWEKFVRRSANVFLVSSGHVLGVGRQTSTNDAGRPVHETLVDYQGLPNGGDGWLRILRFVPDQDKIEVRAYSPLLYETMKDDGHTFTLDYDMTSESTLKKAG
ncbi:MAG: metallophosphoesterase [Desulfosalsimonas sp.]